MCLKKNANSMSIFTKTSHFILLFCLLLLGNTLIYAQQKITRDDVPPMVRSKSVTIFPNNAIDKKTVWEKDGANYVMSFDKKGHKNSVILSPKGKILLLRANIRLDELPNDVFCYLEENYRRYFEDSAMKVVDEKENTIYEVVVFRYENDKTTLLFDEKGKFISKKAK